MFVSLGVGTEAEVRKGLQRRFGLIFAFSWIIVGILGFAGAGVGRSASEVRQKTGCACAFREVGDPSWPTQDAE